MSTPAYTVYGTTKSRAARVVWMLEELELPYEHVAANPRDPSVLAVNPSGKVPALTVDGTVLTDSTAIIQYLADRHGALTCPAGTLERAQQDALTHRILDEFDAVLWTAARHSFILPAEQRVAGVKESLRWEFDRNSTAFAAQMGEGPFLMGETMTVPDILLTHCCLWAGAAKFQIADPALQAYVGRMKERPALRRTFKRD
ncbi:MAG: glutathione S-transferase family protein [Pararhodobacter sp.]|nr:glutathione S-transferase family protein [Pararhodobacter sp.]